jgi:DsbC/DsbD-like thiol-disulfide interchange protein
MNRRTLIASAALLLPRSAYAAKPWSREVLEGGFDGAVHHLGIQILLGKGWKTYWRVPGDGGIPPQIAVTGTNIKDFAFDCPLPQRFEDAAGQTIGYKDEVVFPVRVTPLEPDQPVRADIKAFAGVCEVVCIPADISASVRLSPVRTSQKDVATLQAWEARVPRRSGGVPVTSLKADGESVIAAISKPVADIFVEFLDGKAGFALPPSFGEGTAQIKVKGAQTLSGREVRLTSVVGGTGLEQVLTIA